MRLLQLFTLTCSLLMNTSSLAMSATKSGQECVVVLHGMGRSAGAMEKIEDTLKQMDYHVWNESYDSTTETIETLAESAVGSGVDYCQQQKAGRIHFVTHSLGGILVRQYFQSHRVSELGRIVMLAPPNKGSEIVDLLKEYSLYDYAMGPAGQALSTAADSLPNQLEPIPGQIGVIAGNSTSDPWFSPLIPGEDDGKVSVESTKLAEMKDFRVIDTGHTFIMRNKRVIRQLLYFLKHGQFKPLPTGK